MQDQAPFAVDIRQLRTGLDAARDARRALARLVGIPDEVDGAHAEGLWAERVREVAGAAAGITAGALRERLAPLAATAPALEVQLDGLRRRQHEALHEPGYAGLVTEIRALAEALDAIAPERIRLDGRLGSLSAIAAAVREAQARIAAAPDLTRAAVEQAIRASLDELLRSVDARATSPDLTASAEAVDQLIRSLGPRQRELSERHATLSRRLEELLG